MVKFSNETLIDLFNKGMQNDKNLGTNYKKRQFGLLIIYVFSLFFSKKIKDEVNSVGFINGNRGDELLIKKLYKDILIIFNGSIFKNLLEFKRKHTIFGKSNLTDRFSITYEGLKIYLKNRSKINSWLPDWLNFYSIYKFLLLHATNKFVSVGLKDRYTIWTSYLVRSMGLEYIVIQHGTVGNNIVPNKMECTKMYCINESEKALLRQYIVKNDDCEYVLMDFVSKIKFSEYPDKTDKFLLIGIAEQNNPAFVDEMIKIIKSSNKSVKIIVMLHPLSSIKYYRQYRNDSEVLIDSKNKYINIDVLIVHSSTIVYDYWASKFKGEIVRIKDNESLTIGFDEDKRIVILNKMQLRDYLLDKQNIFFRCNNDC